MINLKNKSIAVVTHRSTLPCIPGEDLKKYLLSNHCKEVFYATHPLLYIKEGHTLSSEGFFYKNGFRIKKFTTLHWKLPETILYIKDLMCTFFWCLNTRTKYDIYFGINNLNALAGIILKKLGKVDKTVYYTIDLFPQRFPNKFINWLYHELDKFCVKNCDETWNVSSFLAEYRNKKGLSKKDSSRQYTVPIGIWCNQIKRVSQEKVNKNKIAYVGHLTPFMGVEMALHAIPKIVKKIPQLEFAIIGGGEQLEYLKSLANNLGVNKNIRFYGWKEKNEALKILSNASIGLAPFNTEVDEKIKNADPAKIKDYLALGLPVILTNAPVNASTISQQRCGVIVDYSSTSIANGILKLITNKPLWTEYRKNALAYIQQFDWNIIFSKNISRLL